MSCKRTKTCSETEALTKKVGTLVHLDGQELLTAYGALHRQTASDEFTKLFHHLVAGAVNCRSVDEGRHLVQLLPRSESALGTDGRQRTDKFHTALPKLLVKAVVFRNCDWKTVGMSTGPVDELSVFAARDSRRVLPADDGTVSQIVIEKLAPLHQHQRPHVTLTGPMTGLGQPLGNDSSAGQLDVPFGQSRTVDTCRSPRNSSQIRHANQNLSISPSPYLGGMIL